jgi:uncharacterized membrane protein YvlD (DUF360 family)
MNYIRSLFINFLIVFFVDRIAPGIEVATYEEVPNIGADILFSMVVGFLNASVFPFLMILELNPTHLKIAIMTFVISFASFTAIAIFPFGVRAVDAGGVFFGGFIVWAIAYFTNYLEMRTDSQK